MNKYNSSNNDKNTSCFAIAYFYYFVFGTFKESKIEVFFGIGSWDRGVLNIVSRWFVYLPTQKSSKNTNFP